VTGEIDASASWLALWPRKAGWAERNGRTAISPASIWPQPCKTSNVQRFEGEDTWNQNGRC